MKTCGRTDTLEASPPWPFGAPFGPKGGWAWRSNLFSQRAVRQLSDQVDPPKSPMLPVHRRSPWLFLPFPRHRSATDKSPRPSSAQDSSGAVGTVPLKSLLSQAAPGASELAAVRGGKHARSSTLRGSSRMGWFGGG